MTIPLTLSPLLARIRPIVAQSKTPVYLVGGAVRDAVLGRVSHDLDFVVEKHAIKLTYAVGNALGLPVYVLDRERDMARVVVPDENTTLDFAAFRTDDSGTLESDLRDRDYTINALALPLAETTADAIIDPCGGMADLAAGVIRPTHAGAIVSDAVRALRGLRLALALDFTLSPEAEQGIRAAAARVELISAERIRDEFLKLLTGSTPHEAITLMHQYGWLQPILPEVAALEPVEQSAPHHERVYAHTLSVLRWLSAIEDGLLHGKTTDSAPITDVVEKLQPFAADLREHFGRNVNGDLTGYYLLRMGALFHDIGKAHTQTIEPSGRIRFLMHEKVGADMLDARLRALRLSREAMQHVEDIVAGHMRPLSLMANPSVSRRSVFKYFKATESAGLDITVLCLADHLATYNGTGPAEDWQRLLNLVEKLLVSYFEAFEAVVAPPVLLDGRMLMQEFGLKPGPDIGRILSAIREAQAAGDISTPDEARTLANKLIANL